MRSMLNFRKTAAMVCISGLMLISAVWVGCGASRQQANNGDAIDIDELLGEESAAQKTDDSGEQAEVLRLLGITPADTQKLEKDVTQTQTSELESEVQNLKQELSAKDQRISELRSEITEKEKMISDLEAKTAPPMPSQKPTFDLAGQPHEPSPDFRARYQSALNLYKSREYQSAMTAFSNLLSTDPNNTLSDNCQYWLGECYYGLGNYNQAIAEFEKVFRFPNTNKADDAQLKLGVCNVKLGDRQQARSAFQQLLSSYPDSEYNSLAQKYLASL